MKKLLLLSLGGAVGYVLGARAGRPAYDRIRDGWDGLTQRSGLDTIATTAKEAAVDVRDMAASKATGAMARGADEVASRIEDLVPDHPTAPDYRGADYRGTDYRGTEQPLATGP